MKTNRFPLCSKKLEHLTSLFIEATLIIVMLDFFLYSCFIFLVWVGGCRAVQQFVNHWRAPTAPWSRDYKMIQELACILATKWVFVSRCKSKDSL